MGGTQSKLCDPVCPEGAVWFILGRVGLCDSHVVEGLPAECFTLPDSEGSSAWWEFLLSDSIGVGAFFHLLNEYAKLVE